MKQLDIRNTTMSAYSFVRGIKQGKVINKFTSTWSNDQKSGLVEAALINIPMKPIFTEIQLQERQKIVVGNEEVNAIKEFMNGEYSLSKVHPDIDGKNFSELSILLQSILEDKMLHVFHIYPSVSDNEIEKLIEMFS
jgi:hypothetical protein